MTQAHEKLIYHEGWLTFNTPLGERVCIVDCFEIGPEERDSRGKRMAAAWNAMQGLDTETVESLNPHQFVKGMREKIEAQDSTIVSMLDALQAVCVFGKEHPFTGIADSGGYGLDLRKVLKIAIEKAEKAASRG